MSSRNNFVSSVVDRSSALYTCCSFCDTCRTVLTTSDFKKTNKTLNVLPTFHEASTVRERF